MSELKRSREAFTIPEHVKRLKACPMPWENEFQLLESAVYSIQQDFVRFICDNVNDVELIAESFKKVRFTETSILVIYERINSLHGIAPLIALIRAIPLVYGDRTDDFLSNVDKDAFYTMMTLLLDGRRYLELVPVFCEITARFPTIRIRPVLAAFKVLEEYDKYELLDELVSMFDTHHHLAALMNYDYPNFEKVYSRVLMHKGYKWGLRLLDQLQRNDGMYLEGKIRLIANIFGHMHDDSRYADDPEEVAHRAEQLANVVKHPFFKQEPHAIRGLLYDAREWSIPVILANCNIFCVDGLVQLFMAYQPFDADTTAKLQKKLVTQAIEREAILIQIALCNEDELIYESANATHKRKVYEGEVFHLWMYSVASVLQEIKTRKQQLIDAGISNDIIGITLSFEFMMYNKTLQHELYLKLSRM